MSKEIRFTELVKKSGSPELATLWTDPRKNRPFMKAVRENRVLTVIQKPTGTQKDFGTLGFHQEKFAIYFVFPKPLPKQSNVRVIGIKYETGTSKISEPKKIFKPATVVSKFVKAEKTLPLKQFEVTILRSACSESILTVSGRNLPEAETSALKMIKEKSFNPKNIRDEIKAIAEI